MSANNQLKITLIKSIFGDQGDEKTLNVIAQDDYNYYDFFGNFDDQTRLDYFFKVTLDTMDPALVGWSDTLELKRNIFKIIPVVTDEVLKFVLNDPSSSSDFEIDLKTKFKTNMDGTAFDNEYSTGHLWYQGTCTPSTVPTFGMNYDKMVENNCCGYFVNNAGTLSFKYDISEDQYCDGKYDISVKAFHHQYPDYTVEYKARVELKMNCQYLINQSHFQIDTYMTKWPEGKQSLEEINQQNISFTVGDLAFLVQPMPLIYPHEKFAYSCIVQYDFVCPPSQASCAYFNEFFTEGTFDPMHSVYWMLPQLRVDPSHHKVMEFSGTQLEIHAYIFSTEVIQRINRDPNDQPNETPHYTGTLGHTDKFQWNVAISGTKNCTPSLIKVTEKTGDTAQLSSSETASEAIQSVPEANRQKTIIRMDLDDEFDSKYCLNEFDSFELRSGQLLNDYESIVKFFPPTVQTGAALLTSEILLTAEANVQVCTGNCCLTTDNQSTPPYVITTSCDLIFEVNAFIGAVDFGSYTQFTYNVKNECSTINSATAPSNYNIWSYSGMSNDFAAFYPYTYEIWHGATPIQFELPKATPMLASEHMGKGYPSTKRECGEEVLYTIGAQIGMIANLIVNQTQDFPVIEISSTDPNFSGLTSDSDFMHLYQIQLSAQIVGFQGIGTFMYDDTKSADQDPLEFYMTDRCLAMFFEYPQVDSNQTDMSGNVTPKSISDASGRVNYHLKAPPDYFFMERVEPFIFPFPSATESAIPANGKCGPIEYYPVALEDPKDFVVWNMTHQINPVVLDPRDRGLEFLMFYDKDYQGSEVEFEVQVNSTYSSLYPTSNLTITIQVRDCLIRSTYNTNEKLDDFNLRSGQVQQRTFLKPYQTPDCGYEWEYVLTNLQVDDFSQSTQFLNVLENDPAMVGTSPTTLNTINGLTVNFYNYQEDFVDLTFVTFLTAKVLVSKFQEPVSLSYEFIRFKIVSEDFILKNESPYIENFVDQFTVIALEKKDLAVGTLTDIETPESVTITEAQLICKQKVDWITLPQTDKVISDVIIKVEVPDGEPDNECTVILKVSDNDVFQPAFANMKLQIQIITTTFKGVDISDFERAEADENSPVTVKSKINQGGQARVEFDKDIMMPANFFNLTSENQGPEFFELKLTIHENNLVAFAEFFDESSQEGRRLQSNELYKFDWKIIQDDESMKFLDFDLTFETPSVISKYGPDQINITCLQEDLLRSYSGMSKAVFEPQLLVLPQQMDQSEASFVEKVKDIINSSLTYFFSSNAIITAFSSVVLYFLWGMINGLQIIALTALFRIRLPSNVMVVNIEVLKLAAFDLFQTEWLIQSVFHFSETPSFSNEFDMAAYEGSNFIIGIAPLFIYMVAYLMFLLLRFTVVKGFEGEPLCGRKIHPWFKSHNIESATIRLVLEGNIDIFLCSLISMLYMKRSWTAGENFQDKLANVFAFVMLASLIYAPIHAFRRVLKFRKIVREQSEQQASEKKQASLALFVGKMVLENKKSLEKQQAETKIKEIFEDFKTDMPSLLYYLLFILRRMLMVATLVFLPTYGNFQVAIYMVSALFMISYAFWVHPYENLSLNRQEINNEAFILMFSYSLIIFSDWIPDQEILTGTNQNLKTTVGRGMLGVLVLYVIVNITIIMYALITRFKNYIRGRMVAKMTLKLMEHRARKEQKQQDATIAQAVFDLENLADMAQQDQAAKKKKRQQKKKGKKRAKKEQVQAKAQIEEIEEDIELSNDNELILSAESHESDEIYEPSLDSHKDEPFVLSEGNLGNPYVYQQGIIVPKMEKTRAGTQLVSPKGSAQGSQRSSNSNLFRPPKQAEFLIKNVDYRHSRNESNQSQSMLITREEPFQPQLLKGITTFDQTQKVYEMNERKTSDVFIHESRDQPKFENSKEYHNAFSAIANLSHHRHKYEQAKLVQQNQLVADPYQSQLPGLQHQLNQVVKNQESSKKQTKKDHFGFH